MAKASFHYVKCKVCGRKYNDTATMRYVHYQTSWHKDALKKKR